MHAADPPAEGQRDRAARPSRRRRRTLVLTVLAALVTLTAGALVLPGRGASGGVAGRAPGPGPKAAKKTARPARTQHPHRSAAARRRARERARERRAVRATLARMPYVRHGAGNRREVALTFDDGPGPYTPRVIDALRRVRAPATFFTVGTMIGPFHRSLLREVRDGFPIGDHTERHPLLSSLSRGAQRDQIVTQTQWLAKYHAPAPDLFRPPYGVFDARTVHILRRRHMLTVLWSVDTEDYRRPGTQAIVDNALRGAAPGAIILMHDAGGPREQTVAAIGAIVHGLRHRGYRLVTVPRLLADDPPRHRQKLPPYFGGGG